MAEHSNSNTSDGLVGERLQVLLRQEETIYRAHDYMSGLQANACSTGWSSQHEITEEWRKKMCEWAFDVVDYFDLNRELVTVAMSHLDRYLVRACAERRVVNDYEFQLLATTCLYLSIKLNESRHLLIPGTETTMGTIQKLGRGVFTLKEMEHAERDVLQRLRWNVHPPTPQDFLRQFFDLLVRNDETRQINSGSVPTKLHEIHDLSIFLIELSAMDYWFVSGSFKSSDIAIAAVSVAADLSGYDGCEGNSAFSNAVSRCVDDADSPAVLVCEQRLAMIYDKSLKDRRQQSRNDALIDDAPGSPKSVVTRFAAGVEAYSC